MPVAPTYPGVYVEELESGVRTITGVATSITAFIGWAPKGPTAEAKRVQSWAEYERACGGLHADSAMSYAVYQFFNNGGTDAYIVRLAGEGADFAKIALGDLAVSANSQGEWGNGYGVGAKARADAPSRFTLTVYQFPPAGAPAGAVPEAVETFSNLSMDPKDPRWVEEVVNSKSELIKVTAPPAAGGAPPSGGPAQFQDGADGTPLTPEMPAFTTALGSTATTEILEKIDLFNLLCVPGLVDSSAVQDMAKRCKERRAFYIADCGREDTITTAAKLPASLGGGAATHGAVYFPWVMAPDPLQQNQISDFPPCGFIAGLYARMDVARGVWSAPAGTDAGLVGVRGVKVPMSDRQNGILNPRGVNCIRTFPVYGTIAWGARTLDGDDEKGSEWKYIPIRRLALYIEETLFRATKWVVFRPNDEPLWASIRLNVGAFMQGLFNQGAFQGRTASEAYYVKCDKDNNPQIDIDRGIVNIEVGFQPLKPAEFVIIKIKQISPLAGNNA